MAGHHLKRPTSARSSGLGTHEEPAARHGSTGGPTSSRRPRRTPESSNMAFTRSWVRSHQLHQLRQQLNRTTKGAEAAPSQRRVSIGGYNRAGPPGDLDRVLPVAYNAISDGTVGRPVWQASRSESSTKRRK